MKYEYNAETMASVYGRITRLKESSINFIEDEIDELGAVVEYPALDHNYKTVYTGQEINQLREIIGYCRYSLKKALATSEVDCEEDLRHIEVISALFQSVYELEGGEWL